jgi:hypothetical protein
MQRLSRATIYINALAIYALLFYSASLFANTQSETFNVTPGGTLIIRTEAGSIDIQTHDRAIIELSVTVKNSEGDKFSYR